MKKVDEMENLKLSYSKIIFPKTRKNKGVCILLNTPSLNDTKQFILNSQKRFRNINVSYKSYYYPYRMNFKVFNKQVMVKNNTDEIYKDIKKETYIMKTYKMLKAYSDNNLLYDLSAYNERYNSKKGTVHGDKCIKEYWNMISNVISEIPHKEKIMVIDIEQWGDKLKNSTTYLYTKASTPLTFLIALILRDFESFKKLDCTFLLLYGKYKIYVDPKQCIKEDTLILLKQSLHIMKPIKEQIDVSEDDKKTDIQINTTEKIQDDISNIVDITPTVVVSKGFTGETKEKKVIDIDEMKKEIADTIDNTVKETSEDIDEDNDEDGDEIEDQVKEKLNNDEEFLSKLDIVSTDAYTNFSADSSPRNKLLAKRQSKIQINKTGKTMDQILNDTSNKKIVPKKVKSKTINTDLKEFKLNNFTKEYNTKLLEKDTMSIFNCFKDKRVPVYILDIKKEDTSDEFDKKYTYTIKMESADRVRHTIKVDMPKFVDNSFLFLGGNKKNIINQFFLKPVSKTSPDTVQLCSNYNKIFLKRNGVKVSPKLERFKKAINLNKGTTQRSPLYIKNGNSTLSNSNYITVMDYDDLATNILDLYINKGQYHIYFNQHSIREAIDTLGLKFIDDETMLPIGIKDRKEIIYLDINTGLVKGTKLTLLDYLIEIINKYVNTFKKDFSSVSVGKRYLYTRATLMGLPVPIIFLCSFLEGMTTTLRKAKVKYYFTDTRPTISSDEKGDKDFIQFSDGYLVYDKYPMSNSLLLNAMTLLPTKEFEYADFDNKETFLSIFGELYNNKSILNGFENFYDLFIDPITLEVLKDLKLPTDFVSLILYANTLLEDNKYTKENNVSLYRIRNNELVNGILYKELAMAYGRYRSTVGNRNPVKMSIRQDAVLRELQASQIVEDYSTLNPILEAEKLRASSFKGLSGLNQERAYTMEKRSYDKSMKGIFTMSTPASGNVGIVRQLPVDMNILSPRGYYKVAESLDELNSSNMYSPAEMVVTGSAQHDDGPRVGMMYMQTKQVVACNNYNERLLTNGIDDVIGGIIGNDFAFKAKEDGQVVEINEDTKLMIVKYKSGKSDVIDLNLRIAKNGAGGMYVPNTLTTNLKVGSKFKENDILAYNDKFFNINDDNTSELKFGVLAKVAMVSGYFNYEDSVMITKKLSSKMVTDVIKKRDTPLGKNSNIDYIIDIGSKVEIGDTLMIFDESFEDESLNRLLASMNTDARDQLKAMSKHSIKTNYAGEVVDIKIYYNVDKNQLSESLIKLINKLEKRNKAIRKNISKYMNVEDTEILLDPDGKVESKYDKIKGVDVGQGVLIEFYINHGVTMGVGDKLVFDTALKGVTCKVCDEGYEPYSEFRKDEEISAFISPIGELARMTKSAEFNLFGNKACIELTRKIREIYEE